MDKLIVVSGGGHAKVIISVVKKLGFYDILGYTDVKDRGSVLGTGFLGDDRVLGKIIQQQPRCNAVLGLGAVEMSNQRERLDLMLKSLGFNLPAIVSPDAICNEEVTLGEGTVVFDGAIVNSGARIGRCAILNTNCSVDHDCEVGNYVHVAPGAALSGGVRVGDHCIVGVGAVIIQNITIKSECFIGAGATVVQDCLRAGTYLGTPARRTAK